jgi:hypothetical protein
MGGGSHVNGLRFTCDWEGGSRVKGRMQGGSHKMFMDDHL